MKHLPDISYTILLLAVAAIISLLPNGKAGAQTNDERKESACIRFKSARKRFDDLPSDPKIHKVLKIEQDLLKVLKLVPEDSPRLCYRKIEPRLLNDKSRWAKHEDITITRCTNYHPNRIIGKIRMLYPPEPRLTSRVYKKGDSRELIVELKNQGTTRLENITMEVRHRSGRLRVKKLRRLPANKTYEFSWDLGAGDQGKMKIIMGEKFGFVSCPQTIHI